MKNFLFVLLVMGLVLSSGPPVCMAKVSYHTDFTWGWI